MFYNVMYLAKPLIKYRMYLSTGWTSSKYLTVIDGREGFYSNVNGLQEEYAARRIILRQTQGILQDWKQINRLVRKNMIASMDSFIENKYSKHMERGKALQSIMHVCYTFPELILQVSMSRLLMKILLGFKLTKVLRSFRRKGVVGA